MTKYALIFGGSQPHSLGHAMAAVLSAMGIVPIIAGRSVHAQTVDAQFPTAQFFTLDLTSPRVGDELLAHSMPDEIDLVVMAGGIFLNGPLVNAAPKQIERLWRTNVIGPQLVLRAFQQRHRGPYQLVTIASTSATKARPDEPVYATTQAARRAFALNFHGQMVTANPDSRSFIVCPGGMRTGMYAETSMNAERFMDPRLVASHIVSAITAQAVGTCVELRIERTGTGEPNVLPLVFHH